MKSVEATGKNIEKAIENALFELRAKREDVDIKILEEGGFFKKAKVLVSISEDCLDKYEKKTVNFEEDDEDTAKRLGFNEKEGRLYLNLVGYFGTCCGCNKK